jgi:hypothetical protein
MREIRLSKGEIAIVDDVDFERVSSYAWFYHPAGYALRTYREDGVTKTERMHRFILDAPKGYDVDHINGNGLDNRRSNIRLATRSQNNYNKGLQLNNTSGYKGVYWVPKKKRWRVVIHVNKKRINIGTFKEKVEAAKAYNKAALMYHGEFAKLNEIKEVQ